MLKIKIKKLLILILSFSSLFSLEINPFVSYIYDSDTDLYVNDNIPIVGASSMPCLFTFAPAISFSPNISNAVWNT